MSRHLLRLLVLMLLPVASLVVAAPPATLGYQGNLANSAGQPITANLTISFRLYDSPSGGAALWTEVQTGVDVDGGNLSVELGSVTPLPRGIWGRQLYLGVQIAGDSEMAPRPALTAAPYALRADGTMKRTIVVSAEGTPSENGAALLAAVAAITDASASSPVAVELDAGTFDLGTTSLTMPSHTLLAGRGQSATLITSSFAPPDFGATVLLSSNTAARDFTARNTGVSVGEADGTIGLGAYIPGQFQVPVTRVLVERVTGESIAPPGTLIGQRAGITLCASISRAVDITARASGSPFASGLRADCPSTHLVIDGATVQVGEARDGVRGVWLVAGFGNEWKRLSIQLAVSPTMQSAFGIRFVAPGVFFMPLEGKLSDSSVTIRGGNLATPTSTARLEGIELSDSAQLALIERVSVHLDRVRASRVTGVRLFERTNNVGSTVRLQDVNVRVTAVQDAALGFGEIVGVRAEGYPPELTRTDIVVDCIGGGYNPCNGIAQPGSWAPVPGTLLLTDSSVRAGHAAPVDSSARSAALEVVGPARVENSRLRVSQSAQNETVRVISLFSANATAQILGSSLVATNAANSNSVCVLAGPSGASGEWFDNYIEGSRCDFGQVNLTCAGNTRRGSGFLASTCP